MLRKVLYGTFFIAVGVLLERFVFNGASQLDRAADAIAQYERSAQADPQTLQTLKALQADLYVALSTHQSDEATRLLTLIIEKARLQ